MAAEQGPTGALARVAGGSRGALLSSCDVWEDTKPEMSRQTELPEPAGKRASGRGAVTTARIAWSLWAVTLALVVGAHVFALASRPLVPLYGYWIESTLIGPTFATLGALIVSRRPRNVIGWLFLIPSVASGMQFFSGQYATVALSETSRLPAGPYAAWLSTLMQSSSVFAIIFLLMLFPTGRLPSPRWRVVAWTTGLAVAVSLISRILAPGPIQDFAPARNPFGIEAASTILAVLEAVGGWMGLICVVAVVVSLVWRFYRSRGEERLQIKWFAYAATLGIAAILLGDFLVPVAFAGWFGAFVWTMAPVSLSVAAAVAVLKYRLYDIDIIIRKTAVYGLLTLSLALVYFGGVATMQRLLSPLVGEGNQLAIVASTLLIAALFVPLRRRIQTTIDRRFYRQRYDAAKILEGFGKRLRNRTDLDALDADLLSVVRETVQPSHASLWLREPGGGPKSEG